MSNARTRNTFLKIHFLGIMLQSIARFGSYKLNYYVKCMNKKHIFKDALSLYYVIICCWLWNITIVLLCQIQA